MRIVCHTQALRLVFATALAMLTIRTEAADALRPVSVSVGVVPGDPGTIATVPVSLLNSSNVVAADFSVTFDTSKVSAAGVVQSGLPGKTRVKSREIAPGVRRVVAYTVGTSLASKTNRTVVKLPFMVSAQERISSGPLVPNNVGLVRRDHSPGGSPELNPGTIFVQRVYRRSDGVIEFYLPSDAGSNYIVQASTNFVQWVNITNLIANDNFMQVVDADAPLYPQRFYRSVLASELIRITSITIQGDGSYRLAIDGSESKTFIIEASSGEGAWTDVDSRTVVNGKIEFVDSTAGLIPRRFYRLKSVP